MKHAALLGIVHNVADSLSSGVSLMTGHYELDVYAEAARVPGGRLTVDFLHAQADGPISQRLRDALPLFRDALRARAGDATADLRAAEACYFSALLDRRFTVVIEDRLGRRSEADYTGIPGRRLRYLDPQGRLRRVPIRSRAASSAP